MDYSMDRRSPIKTIGIYKENISSIDDSHQNIPVGTLNTNRTSSQQQSMRNNSQSSIHLLEMISLLQTSLKEEREENQILRGQVIRLENELSKESLTHRTTSYSSNQSKTQSMIPIKSVMDDLFEERRRTAALHEEINCQHQRFSQEMHLLRQQMLLLLERQRLVNAQLQQVKMYNDELTAELRLSQGRRRLESLMSYELGMGPLQSAKTLNQKPIYDNYQKLTRKLDYFEQSMPTMHQGAANGVDIDHVAATIKQYQVMNGLLSLKVEQLEKSNSQYCKRIEKLQLIIGQQN